MRQSSRRQGFLGPTGLRIRPKILEPSASHTHTHKKTPSFRPFQATRSESHGSGYLKRTERNMLQRTVPEQPTHPLTLHTPSREQPPPRGNRRGSEIPRPRNGTSIANRRTRALVGVLVLTMDARLRRTLRLQHPPRARAFAALPCPCTTPRSETYPTMHAFGVEESGNRYRGKTPSVASGCVTHLMVQPTRRPIPEPWLFSWSGKAGQVRDARGAQVWSQRHGFGRVSLAQGPLRACLGPRTILHTSRRHWRQAMETPRPG